MIVVLATVLALLVLVVLPRCVGRVRPDFAGVVERRGKYHRTVGPGIHPLLAQLERLHRIDLRPQQLVMATQPIITADHLVLMFDVTLDYQVVDPVRATYEIADHRWGLDRLATTVLRRVVGEIPLADVRRSHRRIVADLQRALDHTVGDWGLRVERVSRLEIGEAEHRT